MAERRRVPYWLRVTLAVPAAFVFGVGGGLLLGVLGDALHLLGH